MDVIIFSGQSNMQGQTECLPLENNPVKGAFEYKVMPDELVPLVHPVGESVIVNKLDKHLLGASEGHGSLVPDFCRAYVKNSGREVVAVHCARGNTTISEWLKGTQRYYYMGRKIKDALRKIGKIDRLFFVWFQGESDALMGTSESEYLNKLIAFKNDLKADYGIEKFGIIKTGYFVSTVGWLADGTTKEERIAKDEKIMSALEKAVEIDSDFVMLTRKATELSLDNEYINPNADGHYNNLGMSIIGSDAGKKTAML